MNKPCLGLYKQRHGKEFKGRSFLGRSAELLSQPIPLARSTIELILFSRVLFWVLPAQQILRIVISGLEIFFSHFGEAGTLLLFPKPFIGTGLQSHFCAVGGEITYGWLWGCLLEISKKAISEMKMGIVLFPQLNLFLACILVSGKIVLKFTINFNEKNLSTPSCVATVHQLIGSHKTTETSAFSYFSKINLQFLFTKLQNNIC